MTKQIQIAIIVAIVLGIGIIGLRQFNRSDEKNPEPEIKRNQQQAQNNEKTNHYNNDILKDVKDLIDDEYLPTPVNTSDWQTYQDTKNGFEIQIPNNWYASSEDNRICLRIKDLPLSIEGDLNECVIYISPKEDLAVLENEKFKEVLGSRKKEYNAKIYHTDISGYNSIVQDGFGIETYIIKNNEYWVITSLLRENSEVRKVYPGIIKTFKFF